MLQLRVSGRGRNAMHGLPSDVDPRGCKLTHRDVLHLMLLRLRGVLLGVDASSEVIVVAIWEDFGKCKRENLLRNLSVFVVPQLQQLRAPSMNDHCPNSAS